jgi:hypothetical protein
VTRSTTRFRRAPEDPDAIRHQETGLVRVGGDLWSIGPIHRIVSFAGIGALLLACSLLFHRVEHVVLGERDGAGEA